jgi:hypothetical protein
MKDERSKLGVHAVRHGGKLWLSSAAGKLWVNSTKGWPGSRVLYISILYLDAAVKGTFVPRATGGAKHFSLARRTYAARRLCNLDRGLGRPSRCALLASFTGLGECALAGEGR